MCSISDGGFIVLAPSKWCVYTLLHCSVLCMHSASGGKFTFTFSKKLPEGLDLWEEDQFRAKNKTSLPKQQIGAGHDATISLQIPSKFDGSPKKTCPQCEHYEVCFSECPHSHHPSCTLLINPSAAKIITFSTHWAKALSLECSWINVHCKMQHRYTGSVW